MSIQFDPKESTSPLIKNEPVVQRGQPFLNSSITQNADEIESSECYEMILDCVLKIWDWILNYLGCGEKKKEEIPQEDKKPKPTEKALYLYENSAHPDAELAALDMALKNPRQLIEGLDLAFANSKTFWASDSDWKKAKDPDGNTLLYLFCYCEGVKKVNGVTISSKMIQHLIERGADPKALNGASQYTVWHIVKSIETATILYKEIPGLLEQGDVVLKSTPLHFAVANDRLAIVQFLLDKVNIRTLNATEDTAFYHVQSVKVATLLIEKDPTLVDLKNSSLETPLHRLCNNPFFHNSKQKDEIVNLIKFLIAKGVNKDALDKNGDNAFRKVHHELKQMLLQNRVINN